jgi:hypothetical protein
MQFTSAFRNLLLALVLGGTPLVQRFIDFQSGYLVS